MRYQVISRANQILALIDAVDFDASAKSNIKGQAFFLRAFCYFDLVQYFGSVPLHLTPVTTLKGISGYSLLPNYADIYDVTNKNNAESIFEIQYKQGTEGLQSNFFYTFLVQPITAAEHHGRYGDTRERHDHRRL